MKDSTERLKEISKILAKHDIVHGVNPEKLRAIIEDLGPTFIKLGQIMSMRTDMLPQKYCEELKKLRADVKPMTDDEVKEVLISAYGNNPFENFESFDLKPIGSASIAQVHKAVLKNGDEVVVKIQRIGIKDTMSRDICLIRKATSLLSFANVGGGAIDFNTILDEMWKVSQQEMDFLYEVRNAQEFYELNSNISYVTCPKVYPSLSTHQVMVMEYIDGIQIDNLDELKALGYDLRTIAKYLATNYGKQILEDGFFHADPHPGNIRVRDEQIVWLDMGMMGRLSNRDRQLFKKAVMAIVEKDASEIKDILLTMGTYKDRINHPRLLEEIDELLVKYISADMASINLSELFESIISIANNNSITLPKGVSMFSRGVVTIEGVVAILDPEASIIEIMSKQMTMDVLNDFNIMDEVIDKTRSLYFSSKKAIDIPAHLADLLKMTVRGQSKINLEIMGSEEPLSKINAMVNKIVKCIIIASLLISSSLLCNIKGGSTEFGIPIIGLIGFLLSFILSLWLIIGIFKEKY